MSQILSNNYWQERGVWQTARRQTDFFSQDLHCPGALLWTYLCAPCLHPRHNPRGDVQRTLPVFLRLIFNRFQPWVLPDSEIPSSAAAVFDGGDSDAAGHSSELPQHSNAVNLNCGASQHWSTDSWATAYLMQKQKMPQEPGRTTCDKHVEVVSHDQIIKS